MRARNDNCAPATVIKPTAALSHLDGNAVVAGVIFFRGIWMAQGLRAAHFFLFFATDRKVPRTVAIHYGTNLLANTERKRVELTKTVAKPWARRKHSDASGRLVPPLGPGEGWADSDPATALPTVRQGRRLVS